MKKSISGLKNQLDSKKVLASIQTTSVVGGNNGTTEIRVALCCASV